MLRWLPYIILAVREIAIGCLVSLVVDGQDWLYLVKVAISNYGAHLTLRMIFPMRVLLLNFANMNGSEFSIRESWQHERPSGIWYTNTRVMIAVKIGRLRARG